MRAFNTLLAKGTDQAYALMRIVCGFLFLTHGTQKHFGFPIEFPWPLDGMTAAAGGIELVGGTLIMLGLFTSPAAFLCSGMAAVGYWTVHAPRGLFPIANGGEILTFYCFIFLFIATRGAGIWSLDNLLSKVSSQKS